LSEAEQLQKTIDMLEEQRAVLGSALIDAAQAPLRQRLTALRQEAIGEQRKVVTILFADIEDFTAMGERLDPEDVREILHAYFNRWTACIEKYGGVIEKFIGDAVMAVFGMHTAREDDSERAVLAALEMRATLDELNQQIEAGHGLRLTMRVGIHTGQVVVGLLGERRGQDFVIVGDTVNLASRLQNAAPPNGILVTHDTFRLVRGSFDFRALNPLHIKGKRDPVQAYLVERPKSRTLRFDRTRVETPLVGRVNELNHLQELLQAMLDRSQQQAVLVTGEAGMGKSRLIDEFEIRLELMPYLIRYYKGRASSYLQQQPYALLRDVIFYRFNIQDGDSPQAARQKLIDGLGDPKAVQFIAQLLAIPIDQDPAVRLDSPADARALYDRARLYLTRYLLNASQEYPIVICLEDLHWADDSSLEIIAAMQRELANSPVLWIATARPGITARLEELENPQVFPTRIDLHPLTGSDSMALAERLLAQVEPVGPGGGADSAASLAHLSEPLRELIASSAEGNPFFIEELLRMLTEDEIIVHSNGSWQVQAERLALTRIPPTLTEFLQSRLDSFPHAERALLQRAAVVGRVFWDQAVEYLNVHAPSETKPLMDRSTGDMLNALRDDDIVLQREPSQFESTREFIFTHNLFRDVIYESLLRRHRRIYHAHAARWLEQVTEQSHRSDEFASLIAGHYAQAEENDTAVRWFLRTGELASARYANAEAVHSFTRALELSSSDDVAGRIAILLKREDVYNRQGKRQEQSADLQALDALLDRFNHEPTRAEVFLRQAVLHFYINDYPASIDYAQQAIHLANKTGVPRIAAEAELIWGRVLLWQSENDDALQHLEQAIHISRHEGLKDVEANCLWNMGVVIYNRSDFVESRKLFEQSLEIFNGLNDQIGQSLAIAQIGNVQYNMGYFEDAAERWNSAREIFHWTGQRFREGTVLSNLGSIYHARGDFTMAEKLQKEALAIYIDTNDRNAQAVSLDNLGSLYRERGQFELARSMFDQAIQIAREINDRNNETPFHGDLCVLTTMQGKYDEAIRHGEEALAMAREIGSLYFEAYILLRVGRAYLLSGRVEDARQAFQRSFEANRELGVGVSILEAQISLAAASLAAGQLVEAGALIEEALKVFTEDDLMGCDDPSFTYLTISRVLTACGDPRAGEMSRRAREWLLARAARIDDPEIRRSYLENVPMHRALSAL